MALPVDIDELIAAGLGMIVDGFWPVCLSHLWAS